MLGGKIKLLLTINRKLIKHLENHYLSNFFFNFVIFFLFSNSDHFINRF